MNPTPTERLTILVLLHTSTPMSLADLTVAVGSTPTTMLRLAGQLVKRGLIARQRIHGVMHYSLPIGAVRDRGAYVALSRICDFFVESLREESWRISLLAREGSPIENHVENLAFEIRAMVRAINEAQEMNPDVDEYLDDLGVKTSVPPVEPVPLLDSDRRSEAHHE